MPMNRSQFPKELENDLNAVWSAQEQGLSVGLAENLR